MIFENSDKRFLQLLADEFPTARSAAAEIINLNAIQNLPKGTEHFISDIHGEAEPFLHIIRNASGTVKLKIDETFPELGQAEKKTLATLIYYPAEKLEIIKASGCCMDDFYRTALYRLVKLLKRVSFKYTRSYVRKQLPADYAYILEELLYGSNDEALGLAHHSDDIIRSIVASGYSDDFIIDMCNLISSLSVYRLHVLGDIYDRGSGGDVVLSALKEFHSVDIQWGNHDILWMGAAAGSKACIANVIRICTRYDNLHTLEVGYGISLRPLVTFALKTYGSDSNPYFKAKISASDAMRDTDADSLQKIGKAISILQFKLEGLMVARHPEYEMDSLRLLDKIDYDKGTVLIDGIEYPMSTTFFPTVDPEDPYSLTAEEEAVMDRLAHAFMESKLLQDHVRFLFSNGSLYKRINGNLLFHGCMPLTEDGDFDGIMTEEGRLSGKAWFDYAERRVREAYFRDFGLGETSGTDLFWYLWCGYKSPLFGKKKITTFERMFIDDESTWKEELNPYYRLIDQLPAVEKILAEFGCNVKEGCIINGHIPVKRGESPMKAGGRAIVIDGGFAKAYQKTTGIAGYSLVQNSYGFILTAHEPFESREKAIKEELDIHSTQVAREDISHRILNKDTDQGRQMQERIDALGMLLEAYRQGWLRQGR